MAQNAAVIGIKYFFVDLVGGVIGFPVWWYTRGLKNAARFCFGSISNQWQGLSLSMWLKNLFTPMYGETSIGGKIISFFMRIVVLIGKLIVFVVWSIILVLLFGLYLVALPVVVLLILSGLVGM
ncbi:MAG: hypothetical protein ABIG32_02670 [Candidatus Uhrbacteria bacterium]|nr:hypothetical protein [Patescibacteria group bacterium]MBU1906793.1 hypothetical protein [Patescibacteria group bacterium]